MQNGEKVRNGIMWKIHCSQIHTLEFYEKVMRQKRINKFGG